MLDLRRTFRPAAVAVAGGSLVLMAGVPAVNAAPPSSGTLYVSPTGSNANDGTSCAHATFSTIASAVAAADTGGTVVVCAGVYAESVSIVRQLTLIGEGAVIDATGQPYGIGIGASYSTVTGFEVKNAKADPTTKAPGDGIVTASFGASGPTPSSNDVIVGNKLIDNEGSGIDLESTSYTTVANNIASHNGIGINVTNDLGGASSHNQISGNTANANPGGCGIVLADHTGSGVFANDVIGNTARRNGLGTPSAPNASSGSGIIIAAGGATGGVYDNLLRSNVLSGNGHGGVALHGHAPGPDFSGNKIVSNTIGKNNVRTDYKDLKPTGIYLGDAAPLHITISSNLFKHNTYGVFTAGKVKIKGLGSNGYQHVKHRLKKIAKYAG